MQVQLGATQSFASISWPINVPQMVNSNILLTNMTISNSGPSQTLAQGWLSLARMYSLYKVYGSKVKIRIIPMGENVGADTLDYNLFTVLVPTPAGTSGALTTLAADAAQTLPYAKGKDLMGIGGFNLYAKPISFKHYMNVRKLQGISKGEFESVVAASNPYGATTTVTSPLNAPTNVADWNLCFGSYFGAWGSTVSGLRFTIHLESTYYCKFYERTLSTTI